MRDETLNVVQGDRSERVNRFAAELREGMPLDEALANAVHHVHHTAVVTAALEMLADEGDIDMKRLASSAGMSRASLYRYYPDRSELIVEIAGIGYDELVACTSGLSDVADRIRAVAEYLLAEPAKTIAMVEAAERASTDAVDAMAEMVVGRECNSPWLLGIASLCANNVMTERDVARVRDHVEDLVTLIDG